MKCGFKENYIGHCVNNSPCRIHRDLKCSQCGANGVMECGESESTLNKYLMCASVLCLSEKCIERHNFIYHKNVFKKNIN